MRITLESTFNPEHNTDIKVVIEVGHDDLTISEVLEDLVAPAMSAYGFIVNREEIVYIPKNSDLDIESEDDDIQKQGE